MPPRTADIVSPTWHFLRLDNGSRCYTPKLMAWARTGRIARLMTMFFLVWTSVDLLNPGVCPIEQAPSHASHDVSGTLSPAATTTSNPAVPATEDCFCCCQHIVSVVAWVLRPQVLPVRSVLATPTEDPRTVRIPVDRPPQLA